MSATIEQVMAAAMANPKSCPIDKMAAQFDEIKSAWVVAAGWPEGKEMKLRFTVEVVFEKKPIKLATHQ